MAFGAAVFFLGMVENVAIARVLGRGSNDIEMSACDMICVDGATEKNDMSYIHLSYKCLGSIPEVPCNRKQLRPNKASAVNQEFD